MTEKEKLELLEEAYDKIVDSHEALTKLVDETDDRDEGDALEFAVEELTTVANTLYLLLFREGAEE